MSKFCTQCGNVMDDSARFCSKCGAVSAPFVRPEAQSEPTPTPAPTPINEQPKMYFTPAVELQAEPVQPTVEQPIEQPVQPEPIQQTVEPEIQPEPVQPVVEQPIEQPVQQPVQPEPQFQQYQAYQQPVQPQFQQQYQAYQQPAQPQFQQQYQAYQQYQQPVQPQFQPQFAAPVTEPKPPKKSKKGLMITIVTILLLAAIGIAAFFIVPGLLDKDDDDDSGDDTKTSAKAGTYEAAVENYLNYTYGKNDDVKSIFHKKYVEYVAEENDFSTDEMYETFEENVEEALENTEGAFGENFKVSYEITDKEELDDDDLDDYKDWLSECDIAEDDVTKAYEVTIEITIKGDNSATVSRDLTVIEIDGKWYVSDSFSMLPNLPSNR